jgi:fatty-acyl-CoA synthase
MAATHLNPPDRAKQQCLGIPIYGVDSRVVDPATLRGAARRRGRRDRHARSAGVLGLLEQARGQRQAFIEIDGKRFLRTGDLGRVDEDGYFFMVDRLKRMINARDSRCGRARSSR